MRLALHALVSADLLRSLDLRPFEAFFVTKKRWLSRRPKNQKIDGQIAVPFQGHIGCSFTPSCRDETLHQETAATVFETRCLN